MQRTGRVGRPLAVALTALLVSLAAYLGLGATKGTLVEPVAASYCSYSHYEHISQGSKQFYSVFLGYYDTLHTELITWDGDPFSGYRCGNYKEYEVEQWTTYGTPGSWFTSVRVWVCGTYEGTTSAYNYYVVSPEFNYLLCGRQADNLGSNFHDTYGGENLHVYINQG
jgi:hypothetical protein